MTNYIPPIVGTLILLYAFCMAYRAEKWKRRANIAEAKLLKNNENWEQLIKRGTLPINAETEKYKQQNDL